MKTELFGAFIQQLQGNGEKIMLRIQGHLISIGLIKVNKTFLSLN